MKMLKQSDGVILMLTNAEVIEWMNKFQQKIADNKQILSDYDDVIGDGDHGNNMNRGMDAVKAGLAEKKPDNLSDTFKNIAMDLLSKVGGASGPLYGTAFLKMSKLAKDENVKFEDLIAVGAKGIADRGGAKAGDKTMLDVWLPVADELQHDSLSKEKITGFVELTKNMQARKGRASYLGERSIGHVDAGAVSSGLLFEALLEITD